MSDPSDSHAALVRELARTRCEVQEAQDALEALAHEIAAATGHVRMDQRQQLAVWLSHVRHIQGHLTGALS